MAAKYFELMFFFLTLSFALKNLWSESKNIYLETNSSMEFSNWRLLKSKNMCSDLGSKVDDLIVTAAILDENKIKKTKGPFPSRAL